MISSPGTSNKITDRINQTLASGGFQDGAPGPVTEFVLIRHYARANCERLASAHALLKRVEHIAQHYSKSPFDRHRLKEANEHLEAMREHQQSIYRAQENLGRIIVELAPRIDAATTMQQRLELLNCNQADCAQLEEPDIGLINLIAVYCVEDSAAHRDDEFRDRPLFNAVNAEMMRVMFRTPEGRAASQPIFDEMFAPGGLLHGVPTYYRQPDGTMKRKAPSLVLHDASGSRVIERTSA
jgi:hypothetical protein